MLLRRSGFPDRIHYRGPLGFGRQAGYLRRVGHTPIGQRGIEALHLDLARRGRNRYSFCGWAVASVNDFDAYCDAHGELCGQ